MVNAKRYELTAAQWRRIEALLPGKPGNPGRTGEDNLRFANGVLWVLRSEAHWHGLPEHCGKWKTGAQTLYPLVQSRGYGKSFRASDR